MSLRIILSTLLASFILSACQVKETESSGGLISAHSPTTNKFTVKAPTADNYVNGDVISFQVKFPFNLAVTGTPRLRLVVGATTRYADYVSGDGASTLLFSYMVIGADNDTDGVALQTLELNGGTLKFTSNGVVADANISTVVAATYSSVLVDNAAPTVTSLAFSPTTISTFYPNGSIVSFTATFSEPVYVTGSPQLAVTLNGARSPAYAGGSGTTTLVFSYTVTQTDFDTDGYVFGPAILLNSGTIKDAAGNDATLTYNTATVTTDSASRDIDGRLPHIVSVTPPANGTYLAAQNLDVVVEFDRNVDVSTVVAPFINLTIGSNTRQAAYYSGTGSNTIVFRYTTIPGDVAPSGIVIAPTINNNTSATINGVAQTCPSNVAGAAATNCFYGDVRNTVFIPPVATGVIINSIQPQAISVNRGVDSTLPTWGTAVEDNVWIIGQDLLITVGFNTNVFVNQTSGTPRIQLTLTSGTAYATYLSGGDGQTSLVFKYTVQPNDLAMTGAGISLGTLELNGGTITNSSNTNALTTLPAPSWVTTRIDGVRPKISTVAKPAAGSYSTYKDMNYTVTWSEAVRYTATNTVSFPVNIGGTTRQAVYISGDTTATFIHRPDLTSRNDADGVNLSSPLVATNTVTDLPGNTAADFTFTPPATTDILVDTVIPTVTSITQLPANDSYTAGDVLSFTFNFSEAVTIAVAGANPCVTITIGTTPRCLMPTAGGPATSHVFTYTIVAADNDLNGITMGSAISANATGYVRDIADNPPAAHTAPNLTGVLVDNTAPTITGRAMLNAAGTYTSGTILQIRATYSENVIVDTTGGIPVINVVATSGTLQFAYASGSTTNQLIFEYLVTADDYDFDGLGNASNVVPTGGTIKDGVDLTASNTLGTLALSTRLLVFPGTKLWTRNNMVNIAPAGGATISMVGPNISEPCVSVTIQCRVFDGSANSLSISGGGAITDADTVFVAFRAPSSALNFDLIDGRVELRDNGGVFDVFTNNDIYLNATPYTVGNNHATAFGQSTMNVLQVDHSPVESYPDGVLIPTDFQGSIGEIWIIENLTDPAKKAIIRNYLNSRY